MAIKSLRSVLLSGAAASFFLGSVHPALAEGQGSGTAAREPGASQEEEEIVITAQRRTERLIDVPATVAVLSADTLDAASISNTFELIQVTPGLQVSNTGAFTSFAIRGVSAENTGPGAENNVAIYVDGVYYPSKNAGIFEFPDVESIEVLKGPQGTLYGRNATGGAILFKTTEPTFEPHGRFSARYGRFKERELKAYVSGGLAKHVLAASVSGYFKKDDGYLRSAITGERVGGVKSWLVRGKLLIVPSNNVKVTLAAYYADRKDRDALSFETFNGNSSGVFFPGTILSDYGEDASNTPNVYHNKTLGLSGRAEIDTDLGTLTILSGYTDLDNEVSGDFDNSSAVALDFLVFQPQKTFTQEIYFATRPLGPISLLVGANYYRDVGSFDPTRIFFAGTPVLDIFSKVKTQAYAAFVDGTADITDRLHLSAGLRWTTEKKRHFGAFNDPSYPFVGAKRWNNLSPRVALRYEIANDMNIYASYQRGFKSGLFNSTSFFAPETVRPETVDAFEAGFKGRLSRQLTISLSAFHYIYKDIQVTTFQAGSTVLQNAAKAKIYGADLELVYEPVRDLSLRAAVSPLHAEYTSFPGAVVIAPIPSAFCPPGFVFCGNQNASADLSGNRLPRAPRVSANASVSYTIRPGDQAINLFANLYYSGKFYWEASNRLAQDSYAVLNGRISWNINNGPFSVEVWGRNLTNSKYYISQGIGINADGLLSARPRSLGVAVRAEF